ncbi:MAG: hypothetical protein NC229_04565 [Bacteroides sp.]|nr:hypothetical protein [Bacteroidales bacterium]MCM1068787.1 hypothetical protein [Prevotella sp.]MCM1353928.1 hypothetical protein [Bacteroides sp.]MCM1443326.1 hypothetical protein [Muribaculum sp.]MCM1403192.1 hypothetical protein [Bacteroides sp.]
MKTTIRIFLCVAIAFMSYICVMSVVTPINFKKQRTERETAIIKNLISLRTAEVEFRTQKGYYTADLDSLILFLQTAKKKDVLKEGALTDAQLEAGMTEAKAVKIIAKGNAREIAANGLEGFRRDTIYNNMIEALYKGEYDENTIKDIIYIPYTDQVRYEVEVNNGYQTDKGIKVPLMEIRAHYNTYLSDLDNQERINLIDKKEKLDHYAGLKVGSIDAPNNNAGNWE